MTLSTSFPRAQSIRRALRGKAETLAPPARLLAQSVFNARWKRADHLRCLSVLPAYVDAELAEKVPPSKISFAHQHLLRCDDCAALYADLLETLMLADEGRLPRVAAPSPDLSFLGARGD